MDTVHDHIWDAVNAHLGTQCPLVPGAGRAARHHALWPSAAGGRHLLRLRPDSLRGRPARLRRLCLRPQPRGLHAHLGRVPHRRRLAREPRRAGEAATGLVEKVQAEIDKLGVETDGTGWRAKVFLYCVEVRCPETGWMVPLLPTRVVSKGYSVVADLVPDPKTSPLRHPRPLGCVGQGVGGG